VEAGCRAEDVSLTGQVRWQTPLPTTGAASPWAAGLLAVGGVVVFAEHEMVHGLRLTSGLPLWSYQARQPVSGMWQWHDLVVVLSVAAGKPIPLDSDGSLIGLDAATGAVRWIEPLPTGSQGLSVYPVATADGGLAMRGRGGPFLVVNMADGSVRWRRGVPTGPSDPAAADGLVFLSTSTEVTAYGDQTGVQRWTTADPYLTELLQSADGLLLATSVAPTGTLTAITPATGRIAWQLNASAGVGLSMPAGGPAGIAVTASVPGNVFEPAQVDLLDPRTGRLRWQAHTWLDTGPLFTSAGLIEIEGIVSTGVRIADRNEADGRIEWQDMLPARDDNHPLLLQYGQLALVGGAAVRPGQPTQLSAYRLDTGSLAWRVSLPGNALVSPVSVPGPGALVQPALLIVGCTDPPPGA
jgi:outer membrane protein assembly factor BamB